MHNLQLNQTLANNVIKLPGFVKAHPAGKAGVCVNTTVLLRPFLTTVFDTLHSSRRHNFIGVETFFDRVRKAAPWDVGSVAEKIDCMAI